MMNAKDVLIDFLEDNRRRLHRLFGVLSEESCSWVPDAGANSIAVTVWHMGRIFDVYLTQHIRGEAASEERWFRGGWADRTRYDPRGKGRNEAGMLTGYTREEVSMMPPFSKEQVLGYLDDVYDTVRTYLEAAPMEDLLAPAAGFQGGFSRYQVIQMALLDNIRHLGEVFAIHARRDPAQHEALWN